MSDPIEDDDLEEIHSPAPEIDTKFTAAIEELKKRCLIANLKCENTNPYLGLRIWFPNGREKRAIYVSSEAMALELLGQAFEKLTFVGDYEAICSYEEQYIEASMMSYGPSASLWMRKVLGRGSANDSVSKKVTFSAPAGNPLVEVELCGVWQRLRGVSKSFMHNRPCLIIRNVAVNREVEAVEILEKVANAIFFDIDLRFGAALGLSTKKNLPLVAAGSPKFPDPASAMNMPSSCYDRKPISLYWYGRSATGMPLLQLLAFYQSIEYYFPIYSQKTAIKNLGNLLKDPRFDAHDEADLATVLATFRANRVGGFGDEVGQLRDTLDACLDADAVRAFLNTNTFLIEFFTSSDWKSVSNKQIRLNNPSADLRVDLADRLYDVRCKIVHNKSDGAGKDESILPFSKEAEMLKADIAVARYLSRQVLIANSSKLAF